MSKKEKAKGKKHIVMWVVCVILALFALSMFATGSILSGLCFACGAVLACPKVNSKLSIKRPMLILLLCVIAFAGMITSNSSSDSDTADSEAAEEIVETEDAEETEPDVIDKTAKEEPEQEIEAEAEAKAEAEPEIAAEPETEFEQETDAETEAEADPETEADPEQEPEEEAEEEAEEPAQEEQPTEKIVYITDTGKKYHRSGCRHLKDSKIEIEISKAKSQGYTACGTCNPGE